MAKTRCLRCKGSVYYNSVCKSHFAEQIESRIKKEIRIRGFVKKGEVFLAKDPLSEIILKTVITMPIKVVRSGKHDKEIVLWTLDDEVVDLLSRFFNKKPLKEGKMDRNRVTFVRTIKEDELIAYAKLKKVRLKPRRWSGEQKQIKAMVDSLDKKHPETKFSLLKSVEELKALG